jgi:hypothetical protein
MNLYFIVEGETERKVYPSWLGYLLPELQRVKNPSQAQTNNYYLISGGGYPCLYQEVEAAVENINISQKYNYLIICTDADENSVEYMHQEIREFFGDNQLFLGNTKLQLVIQNSQSFADFPEFYRVLCPGSIAVSLRVMRSRNSPPLLPRSPARRSPVLRSMQVAAPIN